MEREPKPKNMYETMSNDELREFISELNLQLTIATMEASKRAEKMRMKPLAENPPTWKWW